VTPEPVVCLWQAAQRGDWAAARAWHEVIYPLAVAIYRAPPSGRATTRLKACLAILGRIPEEVVRPPFVPLTPAEHDALRVALATVDRATTDLSGRPDIALRAV
jgi:4-hydroxy-tetrahydrodipicolinate synthase